MSPKNTPEYSKNKGVTEYLCNYGMAVEEFRFKLNFMEKKSLTINH
jgi:hypothetical protein